MPKQREGWKRGEGPYSNSDSGVTQGPPDPGAGTAPGKDISAVVDKNTDDWVNGKVVVGYSPKSK